MIPSSEQPAVLITAAEYREGKAAFRHDYLLRGGNSLWRVEEVSSSGEHAPSVICSFVVGPQGYNTVRIRNRATGFVTGVETGPPHSSRLLLLDGPNPLFNYFNAMHLLSIAPGEERIAGVLVCDAEGGVHEEQYGYFFDGTTITVHKGRNRGTDVLELDEHQVLRRVASDQGEVVISRYSAMYLN